MSTSTAVVRTTTRERNRDTSAHYVLLLNLLCVLTRASGYDTNTDKNKEAVRYLNQKEINLVLKLKAHLIQLMVRAIQSNIILPDSSFRNSSN